MNYGCSSCKGLADLFHEVKLLRACKYKSSRGPVTINNPLNIRKNYRRLLNLIKNYTTAEPPQKSFRVGHGKLSLMRFFKTHIGVLLKKHLRKGCLSRLTGACYGYNRELPCKVNQLPGQSSFKHGEIINQARLYVKLKVSLSI